MSCEFWIFFLEKINKKKIKKIQKYKKTTKKSLKRIFRIFMKKNQNLKNIPFSFILKKIH